MDNQDRGAQIPDISLAADPRWLLVQRIVLSSGFVNAHRLSAFLLYVSQQTLHGNASGLNERLIGEAVFERSADYDPRDDNIVRSHASRLRSRLEEFFEKEGAAEPLRVSIPRGSYVPVFEPREPSPLDEADAPFAAEPASFAAAPSIPHQLARPWGLPVRIAAWGLVIACALSITAILLYQRLSVPHTPTHKLWSQMFNKNHQTLIVPADSSLVIARLLTGRQTRLADYAGGSYRQAPDCSRPCDLRMVNTIEGLRYTSMSDLEFAVKVSRMPEAIQDRTEIRYARDLELKDLKESNLILAGSQEADPWMSAISSQMNFVVHDDPDAGPLHIENRHPRPGEMPDYLYDSHDPQHRGLATIAFMPNLSGSGNLLVVQGFSVAGTQAAAEFATSGRDLDALLHAYAGNTALPHFEILLSTIEINGMATRAVPLAWHTYP